MKYIIKKGNHFARFNISRLWPFSGSCIRGTIRFDESCWHKRSDIEYTGWNKLTGVSSLLIHRNSGRLVWQPDFNVPGRILIASYVYDRGRRITHPFASCLTGQDVSFMIIAEGGYYSFECNGNITGIRADSPSVLFKCFPYFGGKSTAPHNMSISIKKKHCNVF
jgi:hypothetical protein